MDYELLIPKDYSYYVTHFNRSEYAGLFARYLERCREFMAAGEGEAEGLVEYAGSLIRPLRRKLMLFDMQRLLSLYTVPALLELGTERSAAFAQSLRGCWNARHPDCAFGGASYGELIAGFEDAGILGFRKFFK